jgi:hypothetical protein
MNNRQSTTPLLKKIEQFSSALGGVFSFSDLWNVIGLQSSDRTAKVINRLIREQILFKVQRGIYTTSDPDLWILASRFKENACISMDSVLAREGLTGSLPGKSVSLIYAGNTQIIETAFGRIRFFKIRKELIFGTRGRPGGVTTSNREKAYLDLLYYHVKGAHFVIDPLKDVDLWKLDFKVIHRYLRAYRNPKFIQFVKGTLHEHTP